MKRYKIELIIEEGSDEFWEDLDKDHESGCDEIVKIIREDLISWPEIKIKLVEFTDK